MQLNKLTPEEESIIINKNTEPAHTGEYENFFENGIYTCRRCNAVLFRSENKFDAHCGWPSFDEAVLGAVKSQLDPDGQRTEISCIRCGAHLGHIFVHEKLTPKDTRYCVNSLSMKFTSGKKYLESLQAAYFSGGCFWCTEASFKSIKGVISTAPGYAGGTKENPVYKEVVTGNTGHAETVKVVYNPTIISYEALLEIFFTVHNPTTLNMQGADVGTQYRSVIFYTTDLEKEIIENFIANLNKNMIFDKPIVTEIKPLNKFYEAEEYHHDYFSKNPNGAYCAAVISPKLSKLRKNLKNYVKI